MFDLDALRHAIARHGPVVRVVIAAHDGSSPREVGASMLVWADGQSGTIGGGALEFEAAAKARSLFAGSPPTPSLPHAGGRGSVALGPGRRASGSASPSPPVGEGWGGGPRVERVALGPALGQCCGGAVTLWYERFDRPPQPVAGLVARGPGEMPLAVRRIQSAARGQGVRPATGLYGSWLVEPVAHPTRQLWVWGAGHVGRALVSVLAPLPGLAITWIDVSPERFPADIPEGVTVLPAADPALLADHAPVEAEHLILTYSHALDLELCHRLLLRGFRGLGLIGSATKWARFRSRLQSLGHSPSSISRIRCPIGDPRLGKHPQAIAVGVAADLLQTPQMAAQETRA